MSDDLIAAILTYTVMGSLALGALQSFVTAILNRGEKELEQRGQVFARSASVAKARLRSLHLAPQRLDQEFAQRSSPPEVELMIEEDPVSRLTATGRLMI